MKMLQAACFIALLPTLAAAQTATTPDGTPKPQPVEPVLAKYHSGPGRIGVRLDVDKATGLPQIVALTKAGSAEAYGFEVGDVIVRIDKNLTSTLTLDEAKLALHGAPGSTVELAVCRDDDPHLIVRALERKLIIGTPIDMINPPTTPLYRRDLP